MVNSFNLLLVQLQIKDFHFQPIRNRGIHTEKSRPSPKGQLYQAQCGAYPDWTRGYPLNPHTMTFPSKVCSLAFNFDEIIPKGKNHANVKTVSEGFPK